eukprot:500862_1
MSSSQIYINDHEEKLELLLCGYTKNILQSSIPNVVVQLIMLFYHHNLKRLFAIDTTQFTTRYDVFEHFRNLSFTLINDLVLILKSNTSNKNNNRNNKSKIYQFVEFEFYCLDSNTHKDV